MWYARCLVELRANKLVHHLKAMSCLNVYGGGWRWPWSRWYVWPRLDWYAVWAAGTIPAYHRGDFNIRVRWRSVVIKYRIRMLTSKQCFGVCLRGARFDPLCDLPGVSVLWLIYSHKSWGSDVHLFREYQSLSCHQSLPTSLFDISTVSLLTNGSGLVVRIESSRYSGEKTLSTTVTYC